MLVHMISFGLVHSVQPFFLKFEELLSFLFTSNFVSKIYIMSRQLFVDSYFYEEIVGNKKTSKGRRSLTFVAKHKD